MRHRLGRGGPESGTEAASAAGQQTLQGGEADAEMRGLSMLYNPGVVQSQCPTRFLL